MTLAKRLEAGPGSRELSDECLLAVGWNEPYRDEGNTKVPFLTPKGHRWRVAVDGPLPDPSRNLHDAVTWMVPEGCFLDIKGCENFQVHCDPDWKGYKPMGRRIPFAKAPSRNDLPRAVCIAGLRAFEAMKEKADG